MPREPPHWRPKTILRFIENLGTATSVVRVETDAGEGFLKALGNPAGPHALACEWVGTQLAERLGLRTLDYALIEVASDDEIPLFGGGLALPGPAFITRFESAMSWGGGGKSLKRLVNLGDIARLVAFDTWTRNCDRHPADLGRRHPHYDNVLLSREGAPGGRLVLKAMDHTHCFTCGSALSARLGNIDHVRDPGVYGLFPAFRPLLFAADLRDACHDLRSIPREDVEAVVASVPAAWEVSDSAKQALARFLVERAAFVAAGLVSRVTGHFEFDV